MTPAPPFPWWYPRKSHEAWSKVRARGATRFILVNGMVAYGGLMFFLIGVLSPLVRNAADMLAPDRLALGAAVWATAGLAWGALTWHFSERNFHKYAARTGTLQS